MDGIQGLYQVEVPGLLMRKGVNSLHEQGFSGLFGSAVSLADVLTSLGSHCHRERHEAGLQQLGSPALHRRFTPRARTQDRSQPCFPCLSETTGSDFFPQKDKIFFPLLCVICFLEVDP